MSSFWAPAYWLPRNVSWKDVPTDFDHLIYPLYFALPMVAIRLVLEAVVGIGCGVLIGVVPREQFVLQALDHLLGGFTRHSRRKRVLECMFRFVCYSLLFGYGLIILWNKPWLEDVTQCWIHYPYHPVSNDVWWYYMIETGFYYSLLFASIFDVRRSDFWELVLHHIITITLLSVSWTINFVRVGTLVLLSHDISDIILEAGKLVKYYKAPKWLVNLFFFAFLTSWFITRLGYFPIVLLWSAFTDAPNLIQPDYRIWNFLQIPYTPRVIILMLLCLLLLHVFWTAIILKIVIRSLTVGEAADVRSDTESEELPSAANGRKKVLKSRKERDAKKQS